MQDLLAPSKTAKGKNGFQVMMDTLPDTHKARWFAGAALNSAEQAMASVMSTVLSRLNAFLDSELEQVLCFDSAIDAEAFASQKSAIFLVLPDRHERIGEQGRWERQCQPLPPDDGAASHDAG